jgi:hypothetical protein
MTRGCASRSAADGIRAGAGHQAIPAMDLDIRPLTSSNFEDLDALFYETGPRGGLPTYHWCWRTYFRVRGQTWSNSSPDANREALRRLAEAGEHDGAIAPGLVAYREGAAVGWVSLAPREELRAAGLLDPSPTDRRPPGLVDRVLRGGTTSPTPGRRGSAPRGRDRIRGRERRQDAGGISAAREPRQGREQRGLRRHAGHVRTGGVHGRRAALLGRVIPASPDHAPRAGLRSTKGFRGPADHRFRRGGPANGASQASSGSDVVSQPTGALVSASAPPFEPISWSRSPHRCTGAIR